MAIVISRDVDNARWLASVNGREPAPIRALPYTLAMARFVRDAAGRSYVIGEPASEAVQPVGEGYRVRIREGQPAPISGAALVTFHQDRMLAHGLAL